MAALPSWLLAARKLLPLSLLLLLAVIGVTAARPMVQESSLSYAGVGVTSSASASTQGSTLGFPRIALKSTLGLPHRAERKLFSWEGVTVDQVISGSLGVIDGEDGDVTQKLVGIFMNAGYNVMVIKSAHSVDGAPGSALVEVSHFWANSLFNVYYKQGPFTVVNYGDGGYENWAFGGVWQRDGSNDEVMLFT